VIISTLDSMSSVAPEIKGDDSGNVYVIWYDGKYGSIDGFHGSVQFRASTDNGKTWKPETTLSYSPTALQPSMAVEENKIGIMWEEYVDTYEDRILARWSHDHGTTWCDTTEVIANGGDVACGIGKDGLFGTWFSRTTGAQIYLRDGVFPSEPPRNIPSNIELFQNYPNPFNGGTNITFDITMEVTGTITIKIFNILGQVVSVELLQTEANKYHYEHKWNAEGYPSGTYFYTINIGEKWIGRKMMLVR